MNEEKDQEETYEGWEGMAKVATKIRALIAKMPPPPEPDDNIGILLNGLNHYAEQVEQYTSTMAQRKLGFEDVE